MRRNPVLADRHAHRNMNAQKAFTNSEQIGWSGRNNRLGLKNRMINLKNSFVLFCLLVMPLALASPPPSYAQSAQNEFMVSGTLWTQSAEARALSYQAYNWAKIRLDEKLKSMPSGKKAAVVLDVDETVLDNSPYQVELIRNGERFPIGWKEWIRKESAKPVAGAVEFCRHAHAKGVAVFYITNRDLDDFPPTLRNLKKLGFPVTKDTLLMRKEVSDKTARRELIAIKHDILLLVGDMLNDFDNLFYKKSVAERAKNVDKMKNNWGDRFIMIPNAMYGDWEASLYEYDWTGTPDSRSGIRHKMLREK